jgi:hypothetical protein
MSELLLDAAGRRRSPATLPEFHAGRPPRNKGMRYPADPPTIEEIVTVMRHAGDGVHGRRLRGLIVVLWRAGLRIHEALAPPRPTWIRAADRCWCGAARAAAAARSAWTTGPGSSSRPGSRPGSSCRRAAVLRRQRRHARAAVGGRRRPLGAAPRRPPSRSTATLCAASTPPRARRRDGPRGRTADRHPTPARAQQPRHHLRLPPGHRQHRDHRHRPRPPRADGPRTQLAASLNSTRPAAGKSRPPRRRPSSRSPARNPVASCSQSAPCIA